ncbi:MAG: hypothetical protein HQL69_03315 [Magnetococcales bacterium]|nr:hypothetical protein [Magnetococcales bacterium]
MLINRQIGIVEFGYRFLKIAFLSLFVATLSGCVTISATPENIQVFRSKELLSVKDLSLAVVPLENFSTTPNAGVIVAKLVSTELYVQGVTNQPPEDTIRRYLKTNSVEKDRVMKPYNSTRLGKRLQVDMILTGTVTEYSYQHGLRADPIVSLVLSLLRTKDGVVMWKASHSMRGSIIGSRETLASTSKSLVQQLVSRLLLKKSTPKDAS